MIRWISAFVDSPPEHFDAASAFWAAVLTGTVSTPRGGEGQYVTIEPPSGDPHLLVQRLDGESRIHLDLHVDAVADASARAIELGATEVEDRGYQIMASPGGFVFCFVSYGGESDRGPQLAHPAPHRADVVCIDAPPETFEAEAQFWAELTGQKLTGSQDFPEFVGLALRHQGLPWNLLVQQLGADDGRQSVHAHLDVSAGESGLAPVVEHHERLGAVVDRRFDDWVVLRDPAGLAYCVTSRNPD